MPLFTLRYLEIRNKHLLPLLGTRIYISQSRLYTVKQLMISGQFNSVRQTDKATFEFICPRDRILETVTSDFELFYTKAHIQERNAKLSPSSISPCWRLVSEYYLFFYAAVALSRLFARGLSYLQNNEATTLSSIISVGAGQIHQIPGGNFRYRVLDPTDPNLLCLRVEFGSKSSHEGVWDLVSEIVREIADMSSADDEELAVLKAVRAFLRHFGSSFMSSLRNDVNYKGDFAKQDSLNSLLHNEHFTASDAEFLRKLLKYSNSLQASDRVHVFSLYGAFIVRLVSRLYGDYFDRLDLPSRRNRTLHSERLARG